MILPVRKAKVTYGSTSVGRDTNIVIDASRTPMRWERVGGVFVFSCEVLVSETTEAAFKTTCASLEAAFDEANVGKAFTIAFAAETHESFDPASNTGFNARPTISKPGSAADSGLSRRYVIGVTIDLPHGASGKNGRRRESWELLTSDSGRSKLKVSGSYTATGASSALTNYTNSVEAYCGTITGALGGVWEGPIDAEVKGDDIHNTVGPGSLGKTLTFSRWYQEILYNKTLAGMVHATLRRVSLVVDHAIEGPGDFVPGGNAFRIHRLTATYSCAVDKSNTDLVSLYESAIKPFIIEECRNKAGGRSIAVVFHKPTLDRHENRIEAEATVHAVGNGRFVRSRVVTIDETDEGLSFLKVWDGRRLSKHKFEGEAFFFRTVRHEYEVLGGAAGAAAAAGGGGGVGAAGIQVNGGFKVSIMESSDLEAGIDNFFGIDASGPGGGGGGPDAQFATAGGVAEPAGLIRDFLGGSLEVEPVQHGIPGERQFLTTKVTKIKRYAYRLEPESGGGTPTGGGDVVRTASPGAGNL